MSNILILNRDTENTVNGSADAMTSSALGAMVKALGHTVTISTLAQLNAVLPPETAYVFFYPELSQILPVEKLMRAHPETTFIMTTGSAKDRSFSPEADGDKFPNFKILPRPFSVDTLKGLLN